MTIITSPSAQAVKHRRRQVSLSLLATSPEQNSWFLACSSLLKELNGNIFARLCTSSVSCLHLVFLNSSFSHSPRQNRIKRRRFHRLQQKLIAPATHSMLSALLHPRQSHGCEHVIRKAKLDYTLYFLLPHILRKKQPVATQA